MTVDEVVALLERHGCHPRRAGAGWVARCPAHDDRKPSLSVSEGRDGQILVHCFSGCTLESILAALGLRWSDLFPDDPLRRGDHHPKRVFTLGPWRSTGKPDFAQYIEACRIPRGHPRLEAIAHSLGVSPESLFRLRTGWDHQRQAVAFPMCDAQKRVVGIRFRRADGSKLSLRGGSEGLFLPIDLEPRPGQLLITEGPTDCAAALTLGFQAIGRPSCRGAQRQAVELVRRLRPAQVVIVADNDTPGLEGGRKLARALILHVSDLRLIQPPPGTKDLRAWVRQGGTPDDLFRAIDAAEGFSLSIGVDT